jgi:hypothetical protein
MMVSDGYSLQNTHNFRKLYARHKETAEEYAKKLETDDLVAFTARLRHAKTGGKNFDGMKLSTVHPYWEKEAAKDQRLIELEPVTSPPDMLAIQAQLGEMNSGDDAKPPAAK